MGAGVADVPSPAAPRMSPGPLAAAPGQVARLRGRIGALQYLALGFGCMIGSAWVILLGDWLGKAGPGGAILGFIGGALVMMAVGSCYAELMARMPEAGSEFIYAHRIYGPRLAFAVGWFMILYYVSVTVFEALALAWLLELLVPGVGSRTLYVAHGAPVTLEMIAVGILASLLIAAVNYRGTRATVISHAVLTYGFLAMALTLFAALLLAGRPGHLQPLLSGAPGRHWLLGSGAIFAFCAYALNGFQAIPQAIEERSDQLRLRSIARIIVAAILAAALFYCIVIVSASVIVPWRSLVSAPLPMVAAVAALPHGASLVTVLLLVTAVSLVKAWNGVFMMAVRLLLAMGRAGYVPAAFARLHPRFGSPVAAVLTVGALTSTGIFLGRAAIEPITDMCAMVLTCNYVLCCVTVLRLRRTPSDAAPGAAANRAAMRLRAPVVWIGVAGSLAMTLLACASPWWEQRGVPLEWRLLALWSLIGLLVFQRIRRGLPARAAQPASSCRLSQ